MTAEFRKHRHTLVIVGNAVILFGFWDIIKLILNLTVNDVLMTALETASPDLDPASRTAAVIIAAILAAALTAISLSVRLYVGRTAIRLGRGKSGKRGLLVFWTVILIFFSAAGIPSAVYGITTGEDILKMASSILMDLTSSITLIGMLIASGKVKELATQAGSSTQTRP